MFEVKFTDSIAIWLHSWYAVLEVIILGPLSKYAWVCSFIFCAWVGLWLFVYWAERRDRYYR